MKSLKIERSFLHGKILDKFKTPCTSVEGFKTILDFVAETRDPTAKTIDPKSFLDTSFDKQLDESSFIKSLY